MVNIKKPKFSLKLTPTAGTYATNPRWSNHDLDPVPVKLRVWTTWDYASYWGSDMLAPPLWTTISTVMSLGFTAREVIPIVFFGFFINGCVISITGQIGAKYRVPYPVVARVTFGMWGCIPAILLRTFVALMWTAITTVQGGGYLQNMVTAIWPSYARFPNRFPESANVTSGGLLMIFLYWMIQTPTSMLPMYRLRWFFAFKMAVVPVCWLALFIWGAAVTHGGGPLVTGPEDVPKGQAPWNALTALNVVIGLFSSLAVNMPDFGRFSKDDRSGYSQFFILPILGTLGSLAPIFVTSAAQKLWGEYIWFMPTVIGLFKSRAAMFFTGFSFMIATMGNQIAAGTYCFGNDISALAPHYVDIRRASFLMGLFCIICTPWNIITEAAALLSFLGGYSCMMGPISGIICTDFYIIRKKAYNVGALYREHDLYWYWHGWNWRGWLSFLIPFAAVLPGFINSIQPTIHISAGAEHIYSFAWLWGFVTASLCYYVICTYISPPTASFSEAVLPPQTEEEERARIEAAEADSISEKELDQKEKLGDEKVQVVEALA